MIGYSKGYRAIFVFFTNAFIICENNGAGGGLTIFGCCFRCKKPIVAPYKGHVETRTHIVCTLADKLF